MARESRYRESRDRDSCRHLSEPPVLLWTCFPPMRVRDHEASPATEVAKEPATGRAQAWKGLWSGTGDHGRGSHLASSAGRAWWIPRWLRRSPPGSKDKIKQLTVEWPSGRVQKFQDLAADRLYTIREPGERSGEPTFATNPNGTPQWGRLARFRGRHQPRGVHGVREPRL